MCTACKCLTMSSDEAMLMGVSLGFLLALTREPEYIEGWRQHLCPVHAKLLLVRFEQANDVVREVG